MWRAGRERCRRWGWGWGRWRREPAWVVTDSPQRGGHVVGEDAELRGERGEDPLAPRLHTFDGNPGELRDARVIEPSDHRQRQQRAVGGVQHRDRVVVSVRHGGAYWGIPGVMSFSSDRSRQSIPDPFKVTNARGRRSWPVAMTLALVMPALTPAVATARTLVRFVHAVPAVGRVQVNVGGDSHAFGSMTFGEATSWRAVRSGALHWSLSSRGHTAAAGTTRVGSGAYDLVVLPRGAHVRVRAYRASAGRPGVGLVRVIHAAPGLGSPQIRVDGRIVDRRLSYTGATAYLALTPGRHRFAGDRPGDSTPFVSRTFSVRAGVADSVLVIGSDGRRIRMITVTDRIATHGTRSVRVRPGQSLWSIARALEGPRASNAAVQHRLVALWHANEKRIGTGDPSLIYPGTRLSI
jgi:nucleoid-associated protein YgaU